MKIIKGNKYPTKNYGMIEVLDYRNGKEVDIVFLDTGSKRTVRPAAVYCGMIKDFYRPIIQGRGFLGEGPHRSRDEERGVNTYRYNAWRAMFNRCYSDKNTSYKTYEGCSVDERWNNFQVFCEDIKKLPGYAAWVSSKETGGEKMELDKDILVPGNKVYSKDTCQFVTQKENSLFALSKPGIRTGRTPKPCKFINPQGEVVEVSRMSELCKKYNLSTAKMYRLKNGFQSTHKGWKRYEE